MTKYRDPEMGPGRRRLPRGKRANAPVFVYLSDDEKELVSWAASLRNESRSQWLGRLALEEAHKLARLHDVMLHGEMPPSAREAMDRLRKSKNRKAN